MYAQHPFQKFMSKYFVFLLIVFFSCQHLQIVFTLVFIRHTFYFAFVMVYKMKNMKICLLTLLQSNRSIPNAIKNPFIFLFHCIEALSFLFTLFIHLFFIQFILSYLTSEHACIAKNACLLAL